MKSSWYWFIGWLLTVLTVFGNGLVIYLVATRKRLRKTDNYFVLSLAVIDCLVGLLYFPVSYACDGSSWCNRRVYRTFASFLTLTSVANLCAMTADRYVAIVKPLSYVRFMTTRRVLLLILSAWGVPIICHLLPKMLLLLTGKEDLRNKLVSSLQFLFEFAACAFMLFASGRVFVIVRKHLRQVAALDNQLRLNTRDSQDTRDLRENRQHPTRPKEAYSGKVLIALVAVFILCFSIAQYHNLQKLITLPKLPRALRLSLRLLFVTNSAANPLVYAFLKKDMKVEARRCFCARSVEPTAIRDQSDSNARES